MTRSYILLLWLTVLLLPSLVMASPLFKVDDDFPGPNRKSKGITVNVPVSRYYPSDTDSALYKVLKQAQILTANVSFMGSDGVPYKQHAWNKGSDRANLKRGIDNSRAIWFAFTRAGVSYNPKNRYLTTFQMRQRNGEMKYYFRRCSVNDLRLGDVLVYRGKAKGHTVMILDPKKKLAWGAHGWDKSKHKDTGVEVQKVVSKNGWYSWDKPSMKLKICWRHKDFTNTSHVSASAVTKKRVALVIGNSDYRVNPLSNPVNDARDMAKVLGELGFDVTLKVNADHETMESAIEAFGKNLGKNAVGLFYFSGHGMQYAGANYLIPINSISKMSEAVHLKYKAVNAGYVLGVMPENGLNIVILDACRNNPFKSFSKSLDRGLTRMASAEGSLIAYATAPGTVAWDGEAGDRNSPYTKHLLRFIKQPNLPIESLLKKVRKAVIQETREESTVQQPWYEASISDEFYFFEGFKTPTTSATKPPSVSTSPVADETTRKMAKIAKLLKTCQFRFENNWLTTGSAGTALDCYKDVLKLEPNNLDASRGLVKIENRYVKWAKRALKKGKKAKARQYLASLRKVNPESPKLAALESQLKSSLSISYLKDLARETANRYQLDAQLVFAIIEQESDWNPKATSYVGAIGLMKIMPATGNSFCHLKIYELYDPAKNIDCGVSYFRTQLTKFQDRNFWEAVILALAAYNAGYGNVKKYGYKVPPFKETQNYVKKILLSYLTNLARETANRYKVDVQLVFAIIQQESAWNPAKISHAGAIGLMQIMPATANSFCHIKKAELFEPAKNIDCGVRYFKKLLTDFFQRGDSIKTVKLALCAYNAGPSRARKGLSRCRRIKETRRYMDNIIAIWLKN